MKLNPVRSLRGVSNPASAAKSMNIYPSGKTAEHSVSNGVKRVLDIVFGVLLGVALTYFPAHAADTANFSITADKTSFAVGDEFPVTFSVDAGPFASTLNIIDFTVKLSDTSFIKSKDMTNPFVAGSIFPNIGSQSVNGDSTNIVAYINPQNPPANRSGAIGTITYKALKAGKVTISYSDIKAAIKGDDTNYQKTSASSLVLDITNAGAAAATSDDAGTFIDASNTTYKLSGSGTNASQAGAKTSTATSQSGAAASAKSTTSGPELIFVIVLAGAVGIYFGIRYYIFRARRI